LEKTEVGESENERGEGRRGERQRNGEKRDAESSGEGDPGAESLGWRGEGGWEDEEGIGTGKEANGGVCCGRKIGVQGCSLGQRRIKEAGRQGTGAAAVCALLWGEGCQIPVLGGGGSLPSDAQAAAHPSGAAAPLEWGLVGGEREVNPLEGVLSASQPVGAFAKEGAAQRSTQECGAGKAGLGGLQECQGDTGKEKRLEWAPNQSPVPEASAEAGAERETDASVQVGAPHEAGEPPPCGLDGFLGARKPSWTRGGLRVALAKAGDLAFALGRRRMQRSPVATSAWPLGLLVLERS